MAENLKLGDYEISQKLSNKNIKLDDADFALALAIKDLSNAIERLRLKL